MAITLGGISLPDVVIENEFSQRQVRAVVEFSLGGSPLIWEDNYYGKDITLVGADDFAWIDRSTLQQLFAIAGVPNAFYTLDYEGELYSVRFKHEMPPVISATPIVPRPNHDSGDYYNNLEIRLMEIEPESISISISQSSSSESESKSSESSSSESSQSSSSSSESVSKSSSSESSVSVSSQSSESSESSFPITTTTTTTTTSTTTTGT